MSLKKGIFFACLLGFCGVSCAQIKSYGTSALKAVGWGQEQESSDTVKNTARPQKSVPVSRARNREVDRNAVSKNAPSVAVSGTLDTGGNSDVIINKTEEQKTRKVESKDLKNAQKPEFRVEAPVDVQKRVGGAARLIRADDAFVYMDFPQYFAVYDRSLNALTHIPIAFPLKRVERTVVDGKTYLYLTEENDVLEILSLSESTTEQSRTYSLRNEVSYEVGGTFRWVDAKTLLIMLPKKLQFLDFSKFDDVKIVNEIPAVDVTDAFAAVDGKYLYLSRAGFLDILDGKTYKLLSSLRIGRDFCFLGVTTAADATKRLMLSLSRTTDVLEVVQYLNLTTDLSGVVGFGETVALSTPLTTYSVDFSGQMVLGEEKPLRLPSAASKDDTASESDGRIASQERAPVRLFGFKEGRFLRGELAQRTDLMAWAVTDGKIYLATPLAISINDLSVDREALAHPMPESAPQTSAPVPLAQIGAVKTLKDEYILTPVHAIEFMSDARKVALLDENHAVVFEYRATRNMHQVFASTNFAADDFSIVEPEVAQPTTYDKLLPTDFGLLAYSRAQRTVSFMGVDFDKMAVLPIKPGDILSWTNFTTDEGEILLIAAKLDKSQKPLIAKPVPAPKSASKKDAEIAKPPAFAGADAVAEKAKPSVPDPSDGDYSVQIYLLKSATEVELLSQVFTTEKPFALRSMEDEILIMTVSGIKFYSIEDLRKPARNDLDKVVFDKPWDFQSVKPFLVNNRAYTLVKDEDRLKVLAFSLTDPNKEQVLLGDIDVTPDQFEGSTFSKGGQLYIVPTSEGTLFYDMTDFKPVAEDKRIAAHWPLPAEYVDVARSGKFVCVALGAKGVYCGDLLFY